MKKLILFFSLLSMSAFASGKLSVQQGYYFQTQKPAPIIGFSIYEKVIGNLAYNGWTGVGWQPRLGEEPVFWATTKHDMEMWFDDLGVSVGYQFQHADQVDVLLASDHSVHAKLTYKLW